MPANPKRNISEKQILEGCIQGDRQCQKRLYDEYSAKMFGICLRYARNYHLAEDLLQEGFLRVFSSIRAFRFEGSFEGWMRRIFVNVSVEILRQRVQMYSIDEVNGTNAEPVNDEFGEDMDANELLKIIQQLSDGYRTIFNLYAIEGYSHQEIAEMLGISEGTSKSQLARARAILQKMVLDSRQIKKYETAIQSK